MQVLESSVADPDEPSKAADILIWVLQNSFFVWIGPHNGSPTLPHLVTSNTSRFDGGMPYASPLYGDGTSEVAEGISKRLAYKFKMFFYICCTLPSAEDPLTALAERKVVEMIKLNI